jgi:HEAT repeat protein
MKSHRDFQFKPTVFPVSVVPVGRFTHGATSDETDEPILLHPRSVKSKSISAIQKLTLAVLLGLAAVSAIARETNFSRTATTNDLSSGSTSAKALEYLFKALNDDTTRPAAIEALVKIGPAAVEPLINALRNTSPFLRSAAAEALGGIKDPRAVEPLIRSVLSDSYEYARAEAAWALASMEDPRAVEPLIEALTDQHQDVRATAELALARLGPLSIEPLIKVLNKKGTAALRNSAVRALGGIKDSSVVEPLIRALDDAAVRDSAAIALGELKEPKAVEPLVRILKDRAHSSSSYVAAALIKIGSPSVEPLGKALNDNDQAVRRLAVIALGEIRDPKAIAALTERSKDESPEVRQAAQEAIEKIQKANQ